ncbi:sphingomyelin synthetase [Holotrichia oblita]|uniref:Sphingomyelin synthetase n=1 Tax=Holotrichia oblita TaxID=644536 RepID=A0ACB9TYB2_HOLOL|nr:sphingomyelin synthetase [Holotrichia oblita]
MEVNCEGNCHMDVYIDTSDLNSVNNSDMNHCSTAVDLYQRQPLLPNANSKDKNNEYFVDEDEENILQHKSNGSNGHTRIEMPLPAPIREEPRYPQEKCKTLTAFMVTIISFIFTLLSLSLVHDRLPDREKYGPLPDVFLDNVPAQDWALDISEYIIIVAVWLMIVIMVLHKHR